MIVAAHLRFVSAAVLLICALSQTCGAFERGQFELGVDGSASRDLFKSTDNRTQVRFPTRIRMGIATASREAIELAAIFDFVSQSGNHTAAIDLSFAITYHLRNQIRGQGSFFLQPIAHMIMVRRKNGNIGSVNFQLGFGGAIGYKVFAQNGLGPRFDLFLLRRLENSAFRSTTTIGIQFGISMFPKMK